MEEAELFAEIAPSPTIDLLQRLVRIPSHPGVPQQESRVVQELSEFLVASGLEVELPEVRDGRPNLVCSVSGRGQGRHLLLCGHTDTVPLNAGEPGYGFSGEIAEGRVRGRGAVDMKGALAAMAAALVAVQRSGRLDAGKVTLAAVIDEEMESLGAEHLIASGFSADGAVVGEPTRNRICLGHKGLEWLEFEFHGRASHGGTPEAGVNAIVGASRFIELARSELIPRFAERRDLLIGPPTLNFGTIQGGDQPSTVAAHCSLTADRRSVPGEDFASIRAELDSLLRQVEGELPGLSTTLRRVPGGMATLEHVALKTDTGEEIVAAVAAARRSETGDVGEYEAFPAWTDGALLAAFGSIPTVIMGPGDLAVAHSPREEIEIEHVLEAARLYAATTLEFCGSA
jgi:acetylornithine deacetylase/succinyl-diaminopimelate desuccinylase